MLQQKVRVRRPRRPRVEPFGIEPIEEQEDKDSNPEQGSSEGPGQGGQGVDFGDSEDHNNDDDADVDSIRFSDSDSEEVPLDTAMEADSHTQFVASSPDADVVDDSSIPGAGAALDLPSSPKPSEPLAKQHLLDEAKAEAELTGPVVSVEPAVAPKALSPPSVPRAPKEDVPVSVTETNQPPAMDACASSSAAAPAETGVTKPCAAKPSQPPKRVIAGRVNTSPSEILCMLAPMPHCKVTLNFCDHRWVASWKGEPHGAWDTKELRQKTFSRKFDNRSEASWKKALEDVHHHIWTKWGLAQAERPLDSGVDPQTPGEISEDILELLSSEVSRLQPPRDYTRH